MPDLSGLKVERPGLELGTVKKDRFEPAHALALWLKTCDNEESIPADSEEAKAYLHGEVIPSAKKGWCLVKAGEYTIIKDCYNAGPESMAAALAVLGNRKQRRVAVLGDMLELGDCAPAEHEKLGKLAAEKADLIFAYGPNAVYVAKGSNGIALTFDDGPSNKVTPRILNTLRDNGVPATFFVLGSQVDRNPDIVRRAYQEGHKIANHGYSHNYSHMYKNTTNLMNDLEADSLDAVEIIMAIEDEFGIEIPDDEAEKFQLIGDLVKYVDENTEE